MLGRRQPAAPPSELAEAAAHIVVVEAHEALVERVAALFPLVNVERAGHVDDAIKTARRPTVVIVGPGQVVVETLERIDTLRTVDGAANVTVVMVAAKLSTALLRDAMRAGVSDVLPESCTNSELTEVIETALGRLEHVGGRGEGRGRVVAVFSPKGGAGATTVAINLAAASVRSGMPSPLLVDADMPFGDVAINLGLDPTHSLADATGADLDEARLRSLYASAANAGGVRCLCGPADPARAEVVTAPDVGRVLELCRRVAPLIVVDTSSAFDEVTLSVLEAADDVVVVATTELAAVKNAKVALDTMRRLGVAPSHTYLVLNRVGPHPRLPVADIERALGHPATCVPEDEAVNRAAHEGQAVVRQAPRSKASRALTALAVQFEELGSSDR